MIGNPVPAETYFFALAKALKPAVSSQGGTAAVLPGVERLFINFYVKIGVKYTSS